jgi:PIN domain nuclease of toxin-antitoxin system
MLEPGRLTEAVAEALSDDAKERWVSPISVWELTILCDKGRITLDSPVDEWVERSRSRSPFVLAPVNLQVALETGRFRLPHRDPADYFLAATARVFELTLVTADEKLIAAGDVPTLANR